MSGAEQFLGFVALTGGLAVFGAAWYALLLFSDPDWRLIWPDSPDTPKPGDVWRDTWIDHFDYGIGDGNVVVAKRNMHSVTILERVTGDMFTFPRSEFESDGRFYFRGQKWKWNPDHPYWPKGATKHRDMDDLAMHQWRHRQALEALSARDTPGRAT